jgi:hypothetical protein
LDRLAEMRDLKGTKMISERGRHFRHFGMGIIVLIYSAMVSGQGASDPVNIDSQQAARRIVAMHQAWGSKLNSPNASLSLKEVFRSGGAVTYRIYANGLPKQSKYGLVSWPVTQAAPGEVLRGVTLDESGLAICAGTPGTCGTPDHPNDPIDLALQPVAGEPSRIALISMDDQNIKAFAKIVPIRKEVRDGECSLEMVLLVPGAQIVLIEAKGFQPNGELTVESSSGGEHHVGHAKASAEGDYSSLLLPAEKGEQSGVADFQLKSIKCNPKLNFEWGKRN